MSETIVRKQYDQLAVIYDLRWKSYIANTLSFLKTWAEISPTETILDVACGTGEFERLLLDECSLQQIVGVDISDKMLAIAKQKCRAYPQVSFQIASASNLPFDNDSFDVIVSANSFHYFDDPLAALKEMRRVLKPDGKVIILDWCRDYLVCKICDIILKVFDPAHKQCYTQNEFHCLLEDADFAIYRATKIRLGVFWGLMVATASLKA
ncbi:class I SAM-dependent methyltransferase [Anabaena cylindrica FACHB-243]|uniref:Methyltransferase type 11 n=1 Tax=Anabaena cylindrica (strain ATCC 27899 / PCC 7122) TaxID=272123 RepID=K9ZSA1_ANACC|nr:MULTISPECIES: class I SAM-dependent methyltransferase [Anabaena]AFZ61220.1 Methyltransferase type 11 [Anabaena cylindrica PCC 7122]MBD2421696.1 class I SAM-dependent methyltransferase [Anabaena cylindrica FACHB-243]MBY5280547.1 class I SAM-dependent methyltransferase [Anabaena sp. CCAP 1446/1C]MBY5308136.1 class I SAM-dependent methyltransferase [Anabaena sp. CCAP 1446/1C]MCM2405401.1 class I SAM-dependent methyltransferase [Anabaena sp. CCAP 1446/1C]